MTRGFVKRQRGAALLAMLAVIMLGSSWYLVSRLNAESGSIEALRKQRNAEVLNRAKLALIGYVAMKAAQTTENEPGALPCPEPAGNAGGDNEGIAAGNLSLPAVGRLPWKTLGIDKLVDASAEPLWYVVANSWGKCSSTTNTVINSNCTSPGSGMTCWSGQLTVDGQANAAVALIIAPGPAMNVAASTGCTERNQARSAPSPSINALNYLECYSTATSTFSTTGPSASFNNQVVKITAAEILPAIEAAIAQRIEREIVPALQAVYTASVWGFGGTKPVYPYPATFSNPSTSAMNGSSGMPGGLLPMVTSETYPNSGTLCTAGASAPRCQPDFVAWVSPSLSGAAMLQPTCASSTATTITCNFYRTCLVSCLSTANYNFAITASASNVGMALRQQSVNVARMTNVNAAPTTAIQLLSTGAASFSISGTTTATTGSGIGGAAGDALCGIALPISNVCKTETITIPINAVFVDHPLLDTRTSGASTNWFTRNKWHELTYYAVVQGHTPAAIATAPGCIDSPPVSVTCLNVSNVSPANKLRAIMILAGRSINGSTRPSSTPADYLEFGNSTGSFEKQSVSSFSRAAIPDTGSSLNAYLLSTTAVTTGNPFQFKALNANTGAATLSASNTGAVAILNSDGSSLTAGEIQVNAVVEAVYNGTQFTLFKRPFNDRIIVIDSNP